MMEENTVKLENEKFENEKLEEKKNGLNIDKSMFEYKYEFHMGDKTFHIRQMIPYVQKEKMAQTLLAATTIFDEELGISYKGYNADMIRYFMILGYYSDLELEEYDTMDGRAEVYDALASYGLWQRIIDIVLNDVYEVDCICMKLEVAACKRFEHIHSLGYRTGKTFESFLGTEDIAQTFAKAEGLNEQLIDMLGAVKEKKQHSEVGGIRFAKKEAAKATKGKNK